MSRPETTLTIRGRQASRRVTLATYLDANAREQCEVDSNRWIKALRLAVVDEDALRDRFLYRGDSLWWFAELYLHKRGRIARLHRCLVGLERLLATEQPQSVQLEEPGDLPVDAARAMLAQHGVAFAAGAGTALPFWNDHLRTAAQSLIYRASAHLSQVGPNRHSGDTGPTDVACFVHAAFWRDDASARRADRETYVGPVLDALAARLPGDRLTLVGVGPRTGYRGRRWWHRLRELGDPSARALPLVPIDTLATRRDVSPSTEVWRNRHAIRRALLGSDELRSASTIRGCDCWRIVAEELTGIASLQFPWSARAMDEAGAALDRLEPAAVATYAEAGGWGRAIALESRRRAIPMIGLQHGFIYRHWLNYQHEPDEMQASVQNSSDRGFPRPDVTLVYDDYAANHLTTHGNFPPGSLEVTGSPRLDALVDAARRLGPEQLRSVRASVGATEEELIVLVASKYTQIGALLPAVLEAAAACPDVRVVIKCHPAEVPTPYEAQATGLDRVVVAPASADLAGLVITARAVVTVNSTVAIDAMVLGTPSLVIGLPSNLSPFVAEGAMAGASGTQEIAPRIRALLYDWEFRADLERTRTMFMRQYQIGSDGRAAERAAEAILSRVAARAEEG